VIGIYGGTFDPVHHGHLRTGVEVHESLCLSRLHWLPSATPPHRPAPLASAAQRLAMLRLAIQERAAWCVDTRELERPGPSYMVDTLVSLRGEFPDVPLLLFMGLDALRGLSSWRRWRNLFDHAHLVVMTRPGYEPPALEPFLAERIAPPTALRETLAGRLCFQPVTPLAISATAIRALIAAGRDPSFLLPDAVLAYIRQHRLYSDSPRF